MRKNCKILGERRKILRISLLIIILTMFSHLEFFRLNQVDAIPQRIMNTPLIGRYGHSMVYDPENQQIILFGGFNFEDDSNLDDMWEYDCKNDVWRELHHTTKPPARSSHEMAYDSINQKFILFGGLERSRFTDKTWIYDPTSKKWTELFPQNSPSPRGSVSMYFDPIIGQTVLFGGYSDDAEGADETWTYDYVNNTWNLLNISIKPRARYGSRMIYDPVNQRGVLFGGRIIGYNVLNDTWEFNLSNNSWTQLDLSEGPSARYWYSMAYDSYNQLIVLFGGSGGVFSVSQETWVFNVTSNHWIQMDPEDSPSNRSSHKCAFDSENRKVVMFGGTISGYSTPYNDTWTFSYEENNWIKHDSRIIEYSPVPGFNIPMIIIALFALPIFNKVKKRFN